MQSLSLLPGGSSKVTWQAVASANGSASVIFSAAAPGSGGVRYSDAVQASLLVQPLAISSGTVQTGQFQSQILLKLTPPDGALPESAAHLSLNASLAGSLLQGAEYLTGFPYGCVEQTMSRALPNAVVARAFRQFGAGDRLSLSGLDGKIAASIQRLVAMQHYDGGWGWWYDDASDGYQTAWVVFGLATIAQAGYIVDENVLEDGADYLRRDIDDFNPPTRAFAVYAMTIAGFGDLELAKAQLNSLDQLDQFSRAALALAFYQLGDAENARSLLDGLRGQLVSEDGKTFHASGTDEDGLYARKFMSSALRSTAMILRAFIAIQPQAAENEGMAQWLQSQRKRYGWGTTNETAYAMLALTDYWYNQQAAISVVPVAVSLNGKLLLTDTLSISRLSLEISIPLSVLKAGENEIVLQSESQARLSYVLDGQMLIAQAEIAAAGIPIQRYYLDPKNKSPLAEIKAGDLVLVRLVFNTKTEISYSILEDHLPGGLQALNERLNTSGHDLLAEAEEWYYYEDRYYYEQYGYNNKEIRAGQVTFFITTLYPGQHVFEYLARAVTPGEFIALPAEFSAMYAADQWGRSASARVVIRER